MARDLPEAFSENGVDTPDGGGTGADPEGGGPRVRVPHLVGVPAAEAHDRALDAGVLAVAENAWHTGAGRALIGRQDPDPGARLAPGAIVRIWISTDSGGPPA